MAYSMRIKKTEQGLLSQSSLKKNCYRLFILFLCCISLVFLAPQTLKASNKIPEDKLKLIAKSFVKKVNKGFDNADKNIAKATYGSNATLAFETLTNTSIPDGEELILRILVGQDKIPLNLDVIAIKQSNDILISLTDFFIATDMSISVNAEKSSATGWFIREEQDFFLDAENETITLMGETQPIISGGIEIKNGDIYATSYTISQWFNMRFILDFKELAILLTTSQPLPAEERYARRKKGLPNFGGSPKPSLPYEEQPYKLATVPSIDVNLNSSYVRFQKNAPNTKQRWSAIGSGDLSYFNTQTFISGNSDDKFNNARITFSKESDEANLLGSLKAKEYSFGDVYATRLPLTGSSSQEQGIHITNSSSNALSSLSTTNIRGDAQPGWDVELYQNERFVGFQEITDDGIYNFKDLSLFIGDNLFRLVFYGPQGEIEEKSENIPVNRNQLATGNSSYDISLTRSNTTTYRKNDFNEPEDGRPHLVARYDAGFGDYGSVHAGIRHRKEELDLKTYLETGITTTIKDTIVNANTAIDAENGGLALELTGRRKLNKHSLLGKAQINTNKFNPGNKNTDPFIIKSDVSINGPLKNFLGLRPNYGFSANYLQRDSGASDVNIATSFGARLGNTIANTSLNYNHKKDIDGSSTETSSGSLNMRGFLKRIRWRFLGEYDITPKAELKKLFASFSYPFNRKVDSFLELEHFLNTNRTEATANLNWKTDKATITPRISLDTDNTLEASVNARFGIGYEPQERNISLYNKRLSSSGGVSAKVFLDKDGDGVFNKDDELLPDIEITAVQARRDAITNESGIAFIPDLAHSRITDIKLNPETFEDPFWMSNYKGLSLKPRKGIVTTLDFPLVVAGEIDGTVYLEDSSGNKRVGKQYSIHLYTPEGEKVQKTISAYDGFYIFSSVPPGSYFLVADAKDAKKTGYTLPLPKRVDIKPDGTTIYGENIVLSRGAPINYTFTSINPPKTNNKSVMPAPEIHTAGIILGQYKSKLAMTLAWYKLKIKYREFGKYFEPTTLVSDITPDPATNIYTLRLKLKTKPILNIDTAQITCKKLAELKFPCSVEIISIYPEEIASIK